MPIQSAAGQEVYTWIHSYTRGDVLVYLYSESCHGCKVVGPLTEHLPDAKPELLVLKCNAEDVPQLTADFAVRTVPTLLLFRDGELVGRRSGTNTQFPWRDLIAFLDEHS